MDHDKMQVEEDRTSSHWTRDASTGLPLADDRSLLSYEQAQTMPGVVPPPCKCGASKPVTPSSAQGARALLSVNMLGSELVCAICHQLFVEASTVECGHSFCRMCIDSWLKTQLTCPICRQTISKHPINSVCLDKAVRVVLDLAQEREAERELQERKKQATMARESECHAQSCLETLFERAIQQGVRVVHISKKWSSREQRRFLDGIERHQGVAREAYCKVVGLTYEWVGRATTEELLVAATNVSLKDVTSSAPTPPSSCPWNKDACIRRLRARLEMYIRYG